MTINTYLLIGTIIGGLFAIALLLLMRLVQINKIEIQTAALGTAGGLSQIRGMHISVHKMDGAAIGQASSLAIFLYSNHLSLFPAM